MALSYCMLAQHQNIGHKCINQLLCCWPSCLALTVIVTRIYHEPVSTAEFEQYRSSAISWTYLQLRFHVKHFTYRAELTTGWGCSLGPRILMAPTKFIQLGLRTFNRAIKKYSKTRLRAYGQCPRRNVGNCPNLH